MENKANSLPDSENSFNISELKGNFTGKIWSGNFSSKIPNLKLNSQIDKHQALLNGGITPSALPQETVDFHYMIAYLRYCLIEYPNWWKEADMGFELYDINVVKEVYNKARSFEEQWVKDVWGEEEKEDGKEKSE